MTSEQLDPPYRTIDFWENNWNTGKTGWHIPEHHPFLVKYGDQLLSGPNKRVFVPLSGKTLDLLWLYKAGHRVVGLEAVERVVVEYGQEHQLNLQQVTTSYGKVYQTPDERLQVIVCDLFNLPPSEVGPFDAVWDRGSIIAINISDRKRYVQLMKGLLAPDFRYLVVTLDYIPTPKFSGPPCSLPPDELVALFGDFADCKILESKDESEVKRHIERGICPVLEHCSLLTPKA